MILREKKLLFIHIPKCGGTSVQKALLPSISDKETNYEYCIGWCPKRKIHMQHATPHELLDLGLITEKEWQEFFTFCIIRNPWERVVSDYFWMKRNLNIKDSFKNFIFKKGEFESSFKLKHLPIYRGDHFTQQSNYLDCFDDLKFDSVLHLENKEELTNLFLQLTGKELSQSNSTPKVSKHYSHMFSDKTLDEFNSLFKRDIKELGYEFEDQRVDMSPMDRIRNYFFN